MSQRIIAFDLMRAIMLFLLVAFHAGISFMNSELNPNLWFFKDSSTHIFFDGFLGFVHTFRHPAFFVISGYVTHQMFQKYSWKEVLSKRFKRLFIPMLITIVLMGPVVHILFAQLKGNVEAFSLEVIYPSSKGHPYRVSTIYVWFLYYLLLFSAVHLVLERFAIGAFFKRFKLGINWFLKTVLILTVLVMGCLMAWQENSLFGDYHLNPAWPSVGGYLVFYIFGIFLANREDALGKIKQFGMLFVILGTVSFVAYSTQGMLVLKEEGNAMRFNYILMISSGLATVFYSFGFLGLALKYYTKQNKMVSYIGKSSYFLYLIHFPILLYFLKISVGFEWNVFIKFFFVLITTCIGSLMLNIIWLKAWRNNPPI